MGGRAQLKTGAPFPSGGFLDLLSFFHLGFVTPTWQQHFLKVKVCHGNENTTDNLSIANSKLDLV